MTIEKIIAILMTLTGLYFAIRFRYIGKTAIEQRRRLNTVLPFPQSERDFDKSAVVITQFMFLFIGIIFFLVGLAKLFK
jgi:hypothetical protein